MSRRFYQTISISAAALLSACGGLPQRQVNVLLADVPGAAPQNVEHLKNNKSFAYTGAAQTFIVPAGVRRLAVVARGGRGSGTFYPPSYAPGGFPGRVYSVIRVRPGEKVYVFVGASGDNGGWNGGGAGGTAGYGGGTGNRGAGASDVRVGGDKLKNRIIVAAGGGGSGSAFSYCYAPGGDGGGLSGKSGGSDGYSNSGGGGGSSYVEPSAIKFRMWPGFKAEGDGLVTFSWN